MGIIFITSLCDGSWGGLLLDFTSSGGLISSWGSPASTAAAGASRSIVPISSDPSGLALVIIMLELTLFILPKPSQNIYFQVRGTTSSLRFRNSARYFLPSSLRK